ncbi:MAG: YaiO family outer membrane beta-barrel protein [Gemmatimonadota bacterium]
MRSVRARGITRISALRRGDRGAVLAELIGLTEPERNSIGFGAELHSPLWHFAEGHLRIAAAPKALSAPDLLIGGEVVQHAASGWNASLSGDHRRYAAMNVSQMLVGAGWSSEEWYIRARGGGLQTAIETMPTGNLVVRRVFADGRSYLEAAASAGGDVFDFGDPAAIAPTPLTGHSTTLALGLQLPLSANTSFSSSIGVGEYGDYGRRLNFEVGFALYVARR